MQENDGGETRIPENDSIASVSWEASEYLHHDKDYMWMVLLIAVTAFLSAAAYFLLKDLFSVAVIVLLAIAVGIYAYRKPKTLSYQISDDGLHISGRLYPYEQFQSFSIVDEGAVHSIYFEPLKRFMPPISIYYDQENEAHIQEVLSANLPFRQRQLDFTDRLFKRLRF